MSYQYRGKPDPSEGLLTVERERRRNAELALTIRNLTAERAQLEANVITVATVLKELRSVVDTTRAETTHMAAYRDAVRQMPPPVHGGRTGLLAATKEIEAYDIKKRPRKERKGPSHGTWRRYYQWKCRCETCAAWSEEQSARNAARYQQRKAAA